MGLSTRDLTVLLVASAIALASFQWEPAFNLTPSDPRPLRTTQGPSEFTNMYAPLQRQPPPLYLTFNISTILTLIFLLHSVAIINSRPEPIVLDHDFDGRNGTSFLATVASIRDSMRQIHILDSVN